MAGTPSPTKLELTEEIERTVNNAVTNGHSLVLGYVGEDGRPHLSFRGSTHVHGAQQLAIWARSATGGLAQALAKHPDVSLVYYNPGPPVGYLSFKGRARVDPAQNDAVWAGTPQPEKNQDPERKGVAVIIDLDSAFGLVAGERFNMDRAAG